MRIDGYVRVSTVRGRHGATFISPSLQQERITKWAALQNATIDRMHIELDESGARADRPLLQQALERVESGQVDGIVVARLDRFGRSLLNSLAAIERIDKAGGIFASVDDGLDLTTNTGRLVLRIMLSLAEFELDRIRSNWDDAARKAVERGVHPCANAPAGYDHGPDRRLVPNALAPWIREAFERRAEGDGFQRIARWLEANNVKTPLGNPGWVANTVYMILKNRVYLGEAHRGPYTNPTAHPPIVDPATWYRAQKPRREAGASRRNELLTGTVRCASCRMAMSTRECRGRPSYICSRHHASGRCPHPAHATVEELDDLVRAAVTKHRPRRASVAALRKAEARLAEAEEALARYRDNVRLETTIGPQRHAAGLAHRMDTIQTAALALAGHNARDETLATTPWDALDTAERREFIAHNIDYVFVHYGRIPLHHRVFICHRGEAPTNLPKRGRKAQPFQPFDPADCEGAAAKRTIPRAFQPRLPEHQLETKLRAFIAKRTTFPEASTFATYGQQDLHIEMALQGGRTRWAKQLGIHAYAPNTKRYQRHPEPTP